MHPSIDVVVLNCTPVAGMPPDTRTLVNLRITIEVVIRCHGLTSGVPTSGRGLAAVVVSACGGGGLAGVLCELVMRFVFG